MSTNYLIAGIFTQLNLYFKQRSDYSVGPWSGGNSLREHRAKMRTHYYIADHQYPELCSVFRCSWAGPKIQSTKDSALMFTKYDFQRYRV